MGGLHPSSAFLPPPSSLLPWLRPRPCTHRARRSEGAQKALRRGQGGQEQENSGCSVGSRGEGEGAAPGWAPAGGLHACVKLWTRPCLMSYSEPFKRRGRNRQPAVGAVGDEPRGWGTDKGRDIHEDPRAVASWRTPALGRMFWKLRGTWDRARKGCLVHPLPPSLVLDAGVPPETQEASSVLEGQEWGRGSQNMHRGVPFTAARRGEPSPASNSEGGRRCHLRSAEHLGVLQSELLSVRRPRGNPLLALQSLDSARWTPDGTRIGGCQPGLDLAVSQAPELTASLTLLPTCPPGSSRSRAPSTLAWAVGVGAGLREPLCWWWQPAESGRCRDLPV